MLPYLIVNAAKSADVTGLLKSAGLFGSADTQTVSMEGVAATVYLADVEQDVKETGVHDPLDELQPRVMTFFAKVDGGYHASVVMAEFMRVKNLYLDAALEALINRGFIHTRRHHFEGIQYGLTSAGRDFVIGEKLDQEPDEEDEGHYA